jgi:AcrR family transcriptional regulator
LSKAERYRQLLHTAQAVVREEDADKLTLGYLAERAGVSKPVVYDHFPTRSALLIELYRWIDTERVNAFRDAMSSTTRSLEETAQMLAHAYIECAADNTNEFHAVGAALAGSQEKAAVYQELLDQCVEMFVSILAPCVGTPTEALRRRCVGLVGAGEALAGAAVRGRWSRGEATATFASMILGVAAVER